MTLEFKKVRGEFRDYLIIFEWGNIAKPFAILDKEDVERLIKEWQEAKIK